MTPVGIGIKGFGFWRSRNEWTGVYYREVREHNANIILKTSYSGVLFNHASNYSCQLRVPLSRNYQDLRCGSSSPPYVCLQTRQLRIHDPQRSTHNRQPHLYKPIYPHSCKNRGFGVRSSIPRSAHMSNLW